MYVSFFAALWNTPSTPRPEWGGLKEFVAPGAFTEALAIGVPTEFRLNHKPGPLASSHDGTLTLRETKEGLQATAYVANRLGGRELYAAIKAGRCRGASFLFSLHDASVVRAHDVFLGPVCRLVKVPHLVDVSLCFGDRGPAYRATAGRVVAFEV